MHAERSAERSKHRSMVLKTVIVLSMILQSLQFSPVQRRLVQRSSAKVTSMPTGKQKQKQKIRAKWLKFVQIQAVDN